VFYLLFKSNGKWLLCVFICLSFVQEIDERKDFFEKKYTRNTNANLKANVNVSVIENLEYRIEPTLENKNKFNKKLFGPGRVVRRIPLDARTIREVP
jgi:phage/plasmid-associated DNA primase